MTANETQRRDGLSLVDHEAQLNSYAIYPRRNLELEDTFEEMDPTSGVGSNDDDNLESRTLVRLG